MFDMPRLNNCGNVVVCHSPHVTSINVYARTCAFDWRGCGGQDERLVYADDAHIVILLLHSIVPYRVVNFSEI